MENIFLKRLEFKVFEEDFVFLKIEGLNKFNLLNFKKFIIFFLGENGIGKFILLEVIVVNWGFNFEGGSINFNFFINDIYLDLYNYLIVGKSVKCVMDGFFLRVESFYNVVIYVENIDLDFFEYGDKFLYY